VFDNTRRRVPISIEVIEDPIHGGIGIREREDSNLSHNESSLDR
jgi:hypothetical protein